MPPTSGGWAGGLDQGGLLHLDTDRGPSGRRRRRAGPVRTPSRPGRQGLLRAAVSRVSGAAPGEAGLPEARRPRACPTGGGGGRRAGMAADLAVRERGFGSRGGVDRARRQRAQGRISDA